MDLDSYEQINFDLELMGYKSLWIKEGETYEIALWEDTLVSVDIDTFIEIEILELINNHRITLGLNPLNNLNVIKSVAYTHTDYMVTINQVNHDNFYQRKNSLMQNAAATKVSENVAYAFSSAESVVNAWINSDGHRATIEGDYTDFDISAEKNDEGKWFFTNIFIKR